MVRTSSRCRPGGRLTGPDPSRFQADHRRWCLVRLLHRAPYFFFNKESRFIEHFSPYCRHCRNFEPTWNRVVDNFEKEKPDLGIHLAQVNCALNGGERALQIFRATNRPSQSWKTCAPRTVLQDTLK